MRWANSLSVGHVPILLLTEYKHSRLFFQSLNTHGLSCCCIVVALVALCLAPVAGGPGFHHIHFKSTIRAANTIARDWSQLKRQLCGTTTCSLCAFLVYRFLGVQADRRERLLVRSWVSKLKDFEGFSLVRFRGSNLIDLECVSVVRFGGFKLADFGGSSFVRFWGCKLLDLKVLYVWVTFPLF